MSRPSVSSSGRTRFSRSSPLPLERPPIILEWGSAVIRVGYTNQFRPQIIALSSSSSSWKKDANKRQWYSVIAPLISKIWDQLFLALGARRVVCVHPPFLPRAWTWAMTKALADRGVPGICFLNGMETIPYIMGWKRGLVVDVGRLEARVQAHVDGMPLCETLQVVPCGFEVVVTGDGGGSEWDTTKKWHWLDERNPLSLMTALSKSIEATPLDVRQDVVANIVLVGGTVMGVPDLGRRVGQRLVALLQKKNDNPAEEEHVLSQHQTQGLTMTPPQWKALASLAPHVSVVSTSPHRADCVSWLGACVWATVWHREEGRIKWISTQQDY